MPILLKNLINEKRSESIKDGNVIDIIREKCSDSLTLYKDYKRLYRGYRSNFNNLYEDYYYINPKTQERKSRDTSNIYTVLLGWLPSWKDWPKRNYSLFVVNSSESARVFGRNIFVVFPYNGAKFVQTDEEDVVATRAFKYFKSKLNPIENVASFIDFEKIIELIDKDFYMKWLVDKDKVTENNINNFIHELNTTITFEKLKETGNIMPGNNFLNRLISIFPKESNYPWFDLFNDLYDPIKNGFKLANMFDLEFGYPYELWTDSECIMVKQYNNNILSLL